MQYSCRFVHDRYGSGDNKTKETAVRDSDRSAYTEPAFLGLELSRVLQIFRALQ